MSAPLPPREKALSSSSNKKQLIDLIVGFVSEKIADKKLHNSLVITGSENTPIEVTAGNIIQREDLTTTHEEADVIIVQQCYKVIESGGSTIVKIISDDTDVFALACHFFPKKRPDVTVLMEPTSRQASRTVTDIGATIQKHESIIDSLLAAHALSGCDSVCHYQGIGKKTVIKVLHLQPLVHLLNPDASIDNVMTEATAFMGMCYGIEAGSTMSGNLI